MSFCVCGGEELLLFDECLRNETTEDRSPSLRALRFSGGGDGFAWRQALLYPSLNYALSFALYLRKFTAKISRLAEKWTHRTLPTGQWHNCLSHRPVDCQSLSAKTPGDFVQPPVRKKKKEKKKKPCRVFGHVTLSLTLISLTWRIGWTPNNASKWQMGFN